ncbi:CHAT domain-containing protein [Microbispora hainanensis]|uniref:CHAT domain-containing protein n=1 Tax=Microbispora hainanensis TaxID=568844 RepID=UPI00324C13C4
MPNQSLLYVTDRRTAFLDARQGSQGELAIGHIRHEWLTQISQRQTKAVFGIVDTFLEFTVTGPRGPIIVELFSPRVINDSFAHWFAALVASHRLHLIGGHSPPGDETLRRYQKGDHDTLPASGRSTYTTWTFPGDPKTLIVLAGGPAAVQHEQANHPDEAQADAQAKPKPLGDPHEITLKAVEKIERYERSGRRNALEQAISLFRQALDATPADSINRPNRLYNLGLALSMWFEETHDMDAHTECINALRQAWTTTPEGDSDITQYAVNLTTELVGRFQLAGEISLLLEAEEVMRKTAATVSPEDPDLPAFQSTFGNVLQLLYEQTGDTSRLIAANQAHRAAIAALPDDDDARITHLSSLGATLSRTFEAFGDLDDLREAIDVQRQVLARTRAGRHEFITASVNLSQSLQLLAERTGNLEALTEAAQLARHAMQSSTKNSSELATCATALSSALTELFTWSGELLPLQEAVEVQRKAIAATPAKSPDRAGHLGNLATTLSVLYERTRDPEVLQEARTAGREAVTMLPADHPDRASLLSNLGTTMMLVFQASEELEHLIEATQLHQEALTVAGSNSPDRASYYSNLGLALRTLYEATGDEPYLEQSILMASNALDATPDDHPDRCAYYYHLGSAHGIRFEKLGDVEALSKARDSFRRATTCVGARVRVRLAAAQGLGWAAMMQHDAQAALPAYEEAVQMLPQIASARLRRSDREHGLGSLAGLAAEAASAALAAGHPARAVELLEETRGVLLAELLELRGGLAELRIHAPDLAQRLASIRDDLDQDVDTQTAKLTRRRTGREWEALLDQIREVPGFQDFLRPPTAIELQPEALIGPIVMVNISPFRGDALILTPDVDRPVKVVQLASITRKDVLAKLKQLHAAIDTVFDAEATFGERGRAHEAIREVLAWTWNTITSPILSKLGYTTIPIHQAWPRIWWCPIGEVAFLPLHAAGIAGTSNNVLDRAVSSYTPTVRALAHARRGRISKLNTSLIVSVPDAPEEEPLPATKEEAEILSALLPTTTVITGPDATQRTVVAALPSHSIVHFSCHGHSDWTDPSTSKLILHDHLINPLTVTALSRLTLTNVSLAFLSACSTSQSNMSLADEAIHIASALQMAGYIHVVGTLWTIGDRAAVRISQEFYTALDSAAPLINKSAHALHTAIRRIRAGYPDHPALWAAHIHIGP